MKKLVCFILLIFAITSCAPDGDYSDTFYAMGTVMRITVYSYPADKAKAAIDEVADYIKSLEQITSAKLPGSELYEVNQKAYNNPVPVSKELLYLISTAGNWTELTGGAFDITLCRLTELWKIGTEDSRIPTSDEIEIALENSGRQYLEIEDNTVSFSHDIKLDLGAVAKGYAADRAVQILEEHGIESAIIDLGGNIYALGEKGKDNWRIGITDPLNPSEVCMVVYVNNKAVVTSGNYERYFEQSGKRYHHIFDPSTGYPAESGIISATVISDNALLADILSTSFFVMGEERTAELYKELSGYKLEYILINEKGEYILSDGFSYEYELV